MRMVVTRSAAHRVDEIMLRCDSISVCEKKKSDTTHDDVFSGEVVLLAQFLQPAVHSVVSEGCG